MTVASVALTVAVAGGSAAYAAPGSLDPSFGSGGTATASGDFGATGVAVGAPNTASNAEIATSAVAGTVGSPQFQVDLFNSAGQLIWQRNPLASAGKALAVATVPAGVSGAGDIVAAGWESVATCPGGGVNAPQEAVVVEYNAAGTEQFATPIGCASAFEFDAVTIDHSGNIVGAGIAGLEALVARFTPNGVADPTFGSGGFTESQMGGSSGVARAVSIVPSGDIVVAGSTVVGTTELGAVAEFTPSHGTLDPEFGIAGAAEISQSGAFAGVAALPGGVVAAAGEATIGVGTTTLVSEFAANGSSNSTVVARPNVGNNTGWTGLTYEPAGNLLIAAGSEGPEAGQSMMLAEYDAANLALNSSFGTGGVVSRSYTNQSATLAAVTVQQDGKAVAAGNAPTTGNATQIGLIRVLGPSVTVGNPPLKQVTTTGVTTVLFTVSLDEKLFSTVVVRLCASAGGNVNGQGSCGNVSFPAGFTVLNVPVSIDITVPVGHSTIVRLSAQPLNGVSPSTTQGTGTATIEHIQGPRPYKGYWLAASDGGIFNFGNTGFYGSTGGIALNKPIVAIATTPDGKGYWLVASDGGIFNFGDAGYHGSTGGIALNKPIVAMATTPDGKGYWLVASDGGIFNFGDAGYYGSTGAVRLAKPIVGMAATPDGKGYWLVASDGGIFNFGDAGFFGSTGGVRLAQPIVGMAAYPGAGGYWLVASDGGIFSFGAARFHGSTGGVRLNKPIVGMDPTYNGQGYWLVASDGGIFTFGNAPYYGSTGAVHLVRPIVGMAG